MEFAQACKGTRGAADRRRRAHRRRRERGAAVPPHAAGRERDRLAQPLPAADRGPRRDQAAASVATPSPPRWRSTRCSSATRASSASPAAPARARSPAAGSAATRAAPRRSRGGCQRLRARALADRAAAAALAPRPRPQPLARRTRRAARRRLRGDRQRPRPRPLPGRAPGRPGRRPPRTRRSRSASRGAAATRAPVLASPAEMAARFADHPEAVAETARLAERLRFDLDRELGYRYPGSEDPDADRTLAEICRGRLELRYAGTPRASRGRAAARRGAAGDPRPRALRASSSCTSTCSSWRARSRPRSADPTRRATCCRRGAGAARA